MSDERSDSYGAWVGDRGRPQSKLFLTLNLDNPYAKLGVSPTAPTPEIADLIDQKRGEANRRLKGKPSHKPDDPDALLIIELDAIAAQIGDDRARSRYDELYPQNLLLTIQQSATERASRTHARAGLISSWLCEFADEDAMLPTPRCFKLWSPAPLDPGIRARLDAFAAPSEDATAADHGEQRPLSLHDLDTASDGG